jgi:hypothetical protein
MSSVRVEMKSPDASGEGWSAANARTQSRQYVEQKLLADTRPRRAADRNGISSTFSSNSP